MVCLMGVAAAGIVMPTLAPQAIQADMAEDGVLWLDCGNMHELAAWADVLAALDL